MAVTLYGPSQVGANFPALMSFVFPITFRSTRSPTPNSLFLTSLLYLWVSLYWYSAIRIVTDSQNSSSMFNYFIINSEFSIGLNPETRALHKFTFTNMTTSAPYVRENKVSPIDLLAIVRYAHRTLGNSSIDPPLAPFNLLFNLFTMALLVAST